MMRVTFDSFYLQDLQDYYRRNECIREQQYLSPEKLLHLAAFCVSKAVTDVAGDAERHRSAPNLEVALDVVRQLASLSENADLVRAQREPFTIVNGETDQERKNGAAGAPLNTPEKCVIGPLWLQRIIGSVLHSKLRA